MKKLFANISYSFNNFYDNLNIKGQIIFSIIVILILILCVILFVTYVIQNIKTKKQIKEYQKKELEEENNLEIKDEYEEKEPLYFSEKTEIEDIAQRVEEALREDTPITLTKFEEDQERTAIISIDELMKRAKELELIDDEKVRNINYLEKYNIEEDEVQRVVDNTIKNEKNTEVKAFKVSQVISPIYGIKKEVINSDDN